MENVEPDGWVLLRYSHEAWVFYKIFSTWRYDNDRWRLSSGADDFSALRLGDGHYVWPQKSGSVYHLPFDGEHCWTLYQGLVLDRHKESIKAKGIEIELVNLSEQINLDQLVMSD